MVVGHDDVDPQRATQRDFVIGGNAVVDGDDEFHALLMQTAHGAFGHAVAFAVSVRNEISYVCMHAAQAFHQHRRGADTVRIIIAVDANVFA